MARSKDCQAASKTLRLSSRQKWSHILRKANAVRDGTGILEVKATGEDASDLAETLDGLADLGTTRLELYRIHF